MDMVDSALERPDVALSKRGMIGLNRVPLRALRSFFLTQNRVDEFFFRKKFQKRIPLHGLRNFFLTQDRVAEIFF